MNQVEPITGASAGAGSVYNNQYNPIYQALISGIKGNEDHVQMMPSLSGFLGGGSAAERAGENQGNDLVEGYNVKYKPPQAAVGE
mmetsp:Transcript_21341/g.33024  ORF Transcript_21341/g.33024 Transcript_21341/m.33024 type:complete len:85 (+) Transcript_21341:211-465(+)